VKRLPFRPLLLGACLWPIGKVGGNTIVMLKPEIGCRNIKLALRTNGRAAFEEAWVSVPSVGADIILPVGLQTAPDLVLLSQKRGRPLPVYTGVDRAPVRIRAKTGRS
jgi:hypothetical protein